MTNLEKLEAFLGKEQSDRLLEVLSVLGVTLPKDFEIWYEIDRENDEWQPIFFDQLLDKKGNYYINLPNPSNQERRFKGPRDEFNRIKFGSNEFNKQYLQVFKDSDNLKQIYYWEMKKDENKTSEIFEIENLTETNKDRFLRAEISLYSNSLETSELEISKMRRIPRFGAQADSSCEFTSMIETLKHRHDKKEYKIEDYYKLVIESLNKDEFNITRDSEVNQLNKRLIRNILYGPITRLVNNLRNCDQSERYQKVLESITSEYEKRKAAAELKCNKAKEFADRAYNCDIEYATKSNEEAVKRLKKQFPGYNE